MEHSKGGCDPRNELALRPAPFRVDTAFAKRLVAANAGVPLALLAWDAAHHGLGVNGVNFAIRTTGLLGLVCLLLSLTITPARKLTGWSWLIALRRTLGLYAFFYLCLHFVIFFLFDRGASVGSTLHEILVRRYLQFGAAGLTLLVPLAVTSTDSMITRLGPRRWKALHRLTYLAASLGALHYYLLVKADVRQPLAFAGVLATLLGARLVGLGLDARTKRAHRALAGTPRPQRIWSGELRVLRVIDETHDVRTFRLGSDGSDRSAPLPFAHQPGQYLNVALVIDGERVNRSYTIASSPTQASSCDVTIKRTASGRASRFAHETLREGSTLRISAPAGRFVFTGVEADGVVLLAGGVGITPLMAIVRYLTDRAWGGPIHLVVAARTKRDVIFADELARLARQFPNFHLVVTLTGEDGAAWTGPRGRISAALLRGAVPGIERFPAYVCGPDAMMPDMQAILRSLGVPADRIKTEAFVSAVTAAADMPANDRARPSPGDRPTPGAPPLLANDANDANDAKDANEHVRAPAVTFRRSGKTADLPADRTILEVAEDAGLDLPFECRSGICGQCKTKLLEGRVTMDVEDALSAEDKAKGIILACQARSAGNVTVDA